MPIPTLLFDTSKANKFVSNDKKHYIFTDIESYVKTVQEEAKQITETYTSAKSDINTDGEVTKVEAPDTMPKRDMRIFPDDPDGNKAWIESEILNRWIWKDYPNNTVMSEDAASFLQEDITAPVISNEYYNKDKERRIQTAKTLVEKVQKISDQVRVTDTRKTTPGLRYLERYAVRMGGASNHRYNFTTTMMYWFWM